jgi:putative hydrolase of the HAD superfamily
MPPQFIYFDMGNVLLHFSHERQAEQVARLTGLRADDVFELFYRGYRDSGGLHWAAECGTASPGEFYAQFCSATQTRPDRAAFESASNDIFWPNRSIVPLIAQLHCAGFRLGVLSNTSQAHWEFVCRRYRVMQVFQVLALSFEIGAMKPDERIYAAASKLAGVSPQEIFFTDDRPENVAAARQAGWDAVVFKSTSHLARELRGRGVATNY